jgi:NADPH-dependent ferric siderophore reductase
MNDVAPAATFRRPPLPRWSLTVVDAFDVTPLMRRVRLVGETLDAFTHRPGQDLVLNVPTADGAIARRHYTIRDFDPDEMLIDIDFVLHGDSPAVNWARAAQLDDTIEADGPRGRTQVAPDADWHFFAGDETCLPGIFAMVESLPAGARASVVLEVAGREDEQPLESAAEVDLRWLHRGGPARPSSPQLIDAVARFEPPAENGHAYLIGETSAVRAQRQGLIARGFPKERITAEGYWRPGRVGGHDHVFDPELLDARGRR